MEKMNLLQHPHLKVIGHLKSMEIIQTIGKDVDTLTLQGETEQIQIKGDSHCLDFIYYLYTNTPPMPLSQLLASTYLPSSVMLYQIDLISKESQEIFTSLKTEIQSLITIIFNQQIFA